MKKRVQRHCRGFTLVEIMIVVAIIGLLSALSIPAFAKARQTSLKQKCIQNQRSIFGTAIRYEMDYNTTLAAIRNNGVLIRNTLLLNGYMDPINNFDCPSSPIKDFDDYVLVYSNNTDLINISCTIEPTLHQFPHP